VRLSSQNVNFYVSKTLNHFGWESFFVLISASARILTA
jgi:hypothetical protein